MSGFASQASYHCNLIGNSVSEFRVFPATRLAGKETYVIIANKREIKSRALRRLLALKEITQQILTALEAL